MTVGINVTTNDGALTVSVKGDGYSVEYTDIEAPGGEYPVTLNERGTYKVYISSGSHSGGYSVAW